MKAIRIWRYLLGAVTLLWIMPQVAEAGRIDIWPYEFGRPNASPLVSSGESEYRFYCDGTVLIGVGDGNCRLFAPVNLPVGKTVTKLKLCCSGGSTAYTSASLLRKTMASNVTQEMAYVYSEGATSVHNEIDTTIGRATVRIGYFYFVEVYVADDTSRIYGVRIYYN